MRRLPRDVSGEQPARSLRAFRYEMARQTGSHMRLTSQQAGEHHVTIPRHDPLRVGTFAAILDDVATHCGLTRDDVVEQLVGRGR
jgi:predicted RNA binding protein YcfA (HicA-like mRNA interferase family)